MHWIVCLCRNGLSRSCWEEYWLWFSSAFACFRRVCSRDIASGVNLIANIIGLRIFHFLSGCLPVRVLRRSVWRILRTQRLHNLFDSAYSLGLFELLRLIRLQDLLLLLIIRTLEWTYSCGLEYGQKTWYQTARRSRFWHSRSCLGRRLRRLILYWLSKRLLLWLFKWRFWRLDRRWRRFIGRSLPTKLERG